MRSRSCPLCGSDDATTRVDLTAESFCSVNWSYRQDYDAILGVARDSRWPVRTCSRCGLSFAGLLPDPAFLDRVYETVIRKDDCIRGAENAEGHARRLRYAATLLRLAPADAKALDFGSGIGVTVRILVACGVDAIGFDPSATRTAQAGLAATHVTGDWDEVERHRPFGMLVLDNVLEHLPEPVATIRRLAGLAAPGAIAFVSVPSYEPAMLARQLHNFENGAPVDMTLNPWEHLNYFSLATLDRLMGEGGFIRLHASELPEPPEVGLRPERDRGARARNTAATLRRLLRWTMDGRGVESVEHAFYRLS
jgi:hypothetical protein